MIRFRLTYTTLLFAGLVLTGCGKSKDRPAANSPHNVPAIQTPPGATKPDELSAERAKLSPADLALVETQEWCVISASERLGAMGPPLKLDIKGQPVFVCCKGCKRKAEADLDNTLATVAELKAKKAGGKPVAPEKKADPKDDKHDHGKADPKGGHDHAADRPRCVKLFFRSASHG